MDNAQCLMTEKEFYAFKRNEGLFMEIIERSIQGDYASIDEIYAAEGLVKSLHKKDLKKGGLTDGNLNNQMSYYDQFRNHKVIETDDIEILNSFCHEILESVGSTGFEVVFCDCEAILGLPGLSILQLLHGENVMIFRTLYGTTKPPIKLIHVLEHEKIRKLWVGVITDILRIQKWAAMHSLEIFSRCNLGKKGRRLGSKKKKSLKHYGNYDFRGERRLYKTAMLTLGFGIWEVQLECGLGTGIVIFD